MRALPRRLAAVAAVAAVVLVATGCTSGGEASVTASDADATYVAMMADHHRQAVALAELAPGRAADAEVLAVAERTVLVQAAEAAQLESWLSRNLAEVAGVHHGDMPGEISSEAFARAEQLVGAAFDRLFVDQLRAHHRGAVAMSDDRLAASGDATISRWAGAIAEGQGAEIVRLDELAARLDAAP